MRPQLGDNVLVDAVDSAEDSPQVMSLLRDLIRDGAITISTEEDNDEEYIDTENGLDDEDEDIIEDEEGEDDADDVDMDDEDEEEEELAALYGYRPINHSASVPRPHPHEAATEPKEAGLELLYSGEFGRLQHQIRSRNKAGNVAKVVLNRGRGIRPTYKEDLATVSTYIHTLSTT